MNRTIIIEYKMREDYCQCCNQKLPDSKISGIRELEISKENLMEHFGDLKGLMEFEEDLEEIISEFVYETISFFATNSYENIIIENSEFDKVKQFILKEVSSSSAV